MLLLTDSIQMKAQIRAVKSPTRLARHSHHAFLLLPEADVILESQKVKEELGKVTDKMKTYF